MALSWACDKGRHRRGVLAFVAFGRITSPVSLSFVYSGHPTDFPPLSFFNRFAAAALMVVVSSMAAMARAYFPGEAGIAYLIGPWWPPSRAPLPVPWCAAGHPSQARHPASSSGLWTRPQRCLDSERCSMTSSP